MKKNFFQLVFMLTIISIFSCKKEEPQGGAGTGTTTALTITLSKTNVNLSYSEDVLITVKDQNNTDVTSSCSITINGNAFNGNKYVPSAMGNFDFVAKKDGITSNTATLVVTNSVATGDSLYVSLSASNLELNELDESIVTVRDKTGADVTNKCQIFMNGTFTSKVIVPATVGSFNITAAKGLIPSTTKVLTVSNKANSPFTQKLLVEDVTGAWCGFCTRLAYSLENYKASKPNCVVVAIHGGGGTDPFKYQYFTNYNTAYSITGYPTVIVNRGDKWDERTSTLNTELSKWAPLGLAIESNVSGNNITGKAKVKYNFNNTSMPLKIVVAVVEDGLLANQTNYYSPSSGYTPYLYGGANPIINFKHDGVMRRAATNLFGDAIPASAQLKDNVYEFNFTTSTTGQTANGTTYSVVPANSRIVAYVIDASTNKVMNVQTAALGTVKNFD